MSAHAEHRVMVLSDGTRWPIDDAPAPYYGCWYRIGSASHSHFSPDSNPEGVRARVLALFPHARAQRLTVWRDGEPEPV